MARYKNPAGNKNKTSHGDQIKWLTGPDMVWHTWYNAIVQAKKKRGDRSPINVDGGPRV